MRGAVGPPIGLVVMLVTYSDLLVSPETFSFRYRRLFLTTEAQNGESRMFPQLILVILGWVYLLFQVA